MPTDYLELSLPRAKRAFPDDVDHNTDDELAKRRKISNIDSEKELWRKIEELKLSHADYTVGWICALPIELAASHAMLDTTHESLPVVDNDTNAYFLGSIGGHNIVMACLPSGQYGTNNAATVASNMMRSFKSIRFGFMVGIGGGVSGEQDVRLGDIVVGTKIIQHDFGKIEAGDKFQGTATPRVPPQVLLNAISKLRALHETNASKIPTILQDMQDRYPKLAEYAYPSSCEDRLFLASYDHGHFGDCGNCSLSKLRQRPQREGKDPHIHYGVIASGNQVIKSAHHRDELAKEHGIICYEMEAAGLTDIFPCVVIRGICDYADSHKNKEWQKYSAATAAAYAKELISAITPGGFNGASSSRPSSSSLNLSYEEAKARRVALLGWIRFEQMHARQATIKTAHFKTCDWLMLHPLYEEWLDDSHATQHHGFFWISGKPGAGKSTIIKFAHRRAREAAREEDAVISFFFNARGDNLERSTFGLYRSFLFQLLERFSDLQAVLDNTVLVPAKPTGCPDINAIQELFCNAILFLGERRLTCFVDAIDECDESQVRDMVVYFESLGENAVAKGAHLKICLSSRHYPYIDIRHGLKLVLEDQLGHGRDMEIYVRSHLRAGRGKHVDDIRAKILQKAGGVFMWVVLVCKILNEEFARGRRARVEERLKEIPAGLSDLFHDILKRDDTNTEALLLCIQWILFATRPLNLKEFYFAMLSGLPELQSRPRIYDPETDSDEEMHIFVTGSSKGLAEVTKTESGTVQFIHESVKDFLVKDGGLQQLWSRHGDSFETFSQERLTRCCHSHITAGISRQIHIPTFEALPHASSEDANNIRNNALRKFPFLGYATEYIFHHANVAAQRSCKRDSLRAISLANWIPLNNMLEGYQSRRYTPKASLTYILAERNYCYLLETHALSREDSYVKGERYSYPFFAALANGNLNAAKILLGQNAKSIPSEQLFPSLGFDATGTRKFYECSANRTGHPLHWAIEEELWVTARIIVESGYLNCSALNRMGQSCIHLAAITGDDNFMQKLLEKITSQTQRIEPSTSYSPTSRIAPSVVSHQGSRILGYVNTHVNTRDKLGRPPLWYACSSLKEGMIRTLLNWGAEPSITSSSGMVFSSPASLTKAIAKLLIDEKLLTRSNLLEIAVKYGLHDVVEYILGGNKVFDITSQGASLLATSAKSNHDTVLRLLLENGAAVGFPKWDSHDILLLLRSRNDQTTLRYLIEHKADADRLFLSACSEGDDALVKILIESSTNITNRAEFLSAGLHLALEGRHETVIRLLVMRGASINLPGFAFQPPLHTASSLGYNAAVKVLLEAGANVNLLDVSGRTALREAFAAGNEAVVRTLISHGAAVQAPSLSDSTSLNEAYEIGHTAVVKLIHHGLSVGAEAASDPEETERLRTAALTLDKTANTRRREELQAPRFDLGPWAAQFVDKYGATGS